MKLYKSTLAILLGIGALATSCEDRLDMTNPNQQTTATFGNTPADLEEAVIAAYNHIRMEGSYARVGYNIDVMRGDEAWNCSQVWYLPFDDLDVSPLDEITGWPWREWYYTINVCNYVTNRLDADGVTLTEQTRRILGQALFLRGLSYYNLAGYYQTVPLITDYSTYSSLEGLYGVNASYDEVLDQVETDFSRAMELLPTNMEGGEWAKGRANKGAAAGFYARTLMQRHKYSEALAILEKFINTKEMGDYHLVDNYGDNFREGPAYENNPESIFEVQFLDKDQQGVDDEWTPVNTSPNATQGNAIESNFAPGDVGGWADIAASPWLYELFKSERTTSGKLDPRLYWTIGTYENDWEGFENGNVCYTKPMDPNTPIVVNNNYGGLPIAKWTHFRTKEYDAVVTGLHSGINLRLMRYSDVLLRAAECINEISGPNQVAIDYINEVRKRANLAELQLKDFTTTEKLFEQIANVERPKEFGCEYGRGFDLLRWGFFYSADRLQQLKEHGTFRRTTDKTLAKEPVSYSDIAYDSELKSSYDSFAPGHEFLPIWQANLDANPNLKGNSANNNTDNSGYFKQNEWSVHPVVNLK